MTYIKESSTSNPAGNPTLTETKVPAIESGEYERFVDLARALIVVPKSEIDKARKAEKS